MRFIASCTYAMLASQAMNSELTENQIRAYQRKRNQKIPIRRTNLQNPLKRPERFTQAMTLDSKTPTKIQLENKTQEMKLYERKQNHLERSNVTSKPKLKAGGAVSALSLNPVSALNLMFTAVIQTLKLASKEKRHKGVNHLAMSALIFSVTFYSMLSPGNFFFLTAATFLTSNTMHSIFPAIAEGFKGASAAFRKKLSLPWVIVEGFKKGTTAFYARLLTTGGLPFIFGVAMWYKAGTILFGGNIFFSIVTYLIQMIAVPIMSRETSNYWFKKVCDPETAYRGAGLLFPVATMHLIPLSTSMLGSLWLLDAISLTTIATSLALYGGAVVSNHALINYKVAERGDIEEKLTTHAKKVIDFSSNGLWDIPKKGYKKGVGLVLLVSLFHIGSLSFKAYLNQ